MLEDVRIGRDWDLAGMWAIVVDNLLHLMVGEI